MPLVEEFSRQGELLFRWRSYLPVVFIPIFILALGHAEGLEQWVGDRMDDLYDWLCIGVTIAGLAWRAFVAGTVPRATSGRNTKHQKAGSLNKTGAYSVVRHPLYLGNFLVFFGVAMAPGVWWLALVGALTYAVYYERIMFREEAFLLATFKEEYRNWSESTPAFVPSWAHWTPPELPFSWKTALRREYLTLLGAATTFAVVDYAEDLFGSGHLEWEPDTTIPFLAILLFCFVVRWIRKRTRLLHEEGR